MMKFLVVVLVFFQFALLGQQQVRVFVSYTNSYCGGARPTDEILLKYNTAHKLSNFKIKLSGKKISLITTDSLGFFTCKLKPGNYFIFLTEEKNKNIITNYNPDCIKMLKTAYAELHIEKGKSTYDVKLNFPCNPCELNNKP